MLHPLINVYVLYILYVSGNCYNFYNVTILNNDLSIYDFSDFCVCVCVCVCVCACVRARVSACEQGTR